MTDQIKLWVEKLRDAPSEDIVHNLIEAGEGAFPAVLAAWSHEKDTKIRNRFFEILAEIPTKEIAPIFEEKLSSANSEEARFAALGLLRLDVLNYAPKILESLQAHPVLSKETQFLDYILDSLNAAKRRQP